MIMAGRRGSSAQRQIKKIDMSKKPGKSASIADWGNFLIDSLKTVNDNMESLASATSNACDQAAEAIQGINNVKLTVDTVNATLQCLANENERLHIENKALQERMVKLECYQRRNNLVFQGIAEEKGETAEKCEKKILDALENITGLPQNIKISRSHRVGPFRNDHTRPIVCHIHWYKNKVKILRGKKQLPDGIYVEEDFPPEVIERRKILRPVLKAALQKEDYKNNTYLSVDRLVINNTVYTCAPINNLDSLPEDLNPRLLSERSDEETLVYFGIGSPFSNFHKSNFVIDNVKYCCNEQFIQSQKAASCNDDRAQSRIMNTDSPYRMKQIGSALHNFDKKKWEKKLRAVAKKGALAKFDQNPHLAEALISTEERQLAEASKEAPWGNGMTLNEEGVLDEQNWSATPGVMGLVLMEIREILVAKQKRK